MGPSQRIALRAMDPIVLGARIRAARLGLGLTQGQVLVQRAGAAYLSRIEKGDRLPSAPVLEEIADALGIDVDKLLASPPPAAGDVAPAELGRRIRTLRIGLGLTQQQVLGSSPGYLSRIETGQRRPAPAVLEQIAAMLKTTVDELLSDAPQLAGAPLPAADTVADPSAVQRDVAAARVVARATAAWLREPTNPTAYRTMTVAVRRWEEVCHEPGASTRSTPGASSAIDSAIEAASDGAAELAEVAWSPGEVWTA